MVFLWNSVPHRKERKALDAAIKPANRQERKALKRFGKAASSLLLRETELVAREHSFEGVREKVLNASKPVAQDGTRVRVNLTPFVPADLVLNDNVFPPLASVLIMAGMRNYERREILLHADYNPHTCKLSVTIPAGISYGVKDNGLVKSAVAMLAGSIEVTTRNDTVLTVHAKTAKANQQEKQAKPG